MYKTGKHDLFFSFPVRTKVTEEGHPRKKQLANMDILNQRQRFRERRNCSSI